MTKSTEEQADVQPRTRRSFLGAAAAALGAVAAQTIASATPAGAATGSTVKAGQTNTATANTVVKNTKSGGRGLHGWASSTASSSSSTGVRGQSDSPSGSGVVGTGKSYGVRGLSSAAASVAVHGRASGSEATGVVGDATYGVSGHGAVTGTSGVGPVGVAGVSVTSLGRGVHGAGDYGVYGLGDVANNSYGVFGTGPYGVVGRGTRTAVTGSATAAGSTGVSGTGAAVGVYGRGTAASAIAVHGDGTAIGVYGRGKDGVVGERIAVGDFAGRFRGPVEVTTNLYVNQTLHGYGDANISGNLAVAGHLSKGGGSFLIDHPLDPANRYLAHSFVESPDMLNVYSGSVKLNTRGRATVRLPRYYHALNSDHRVQLTPVGAPAPDLHLAREVEDFRFTIAGGQPGQKVFWQVTGIRQDAWARKHRIKVDTPKKKKDRGRYLAPEAFGKGRKQRIGEDERPRSKPAGKRIIAAGRRSEAPERARARAVRVPDVTNSPADD